MNTLLESLSHDRYAECRRAFAITTGMPSTQKLPNARLWARPPRTWRFVERLPSLVRLAAAPCAAPLQIEHMERAGLGIRVDCAGDIVHYIDAERVGDPMKRLCDRVEDALRGLRARQIPRFVIVSRHHSAEAAL